MPTGTALTLLARPGAAQRRVVAGSRGVPTRLVIDVGDALAPCLEGIALCEDIVSGVNRIVMAAAAGSRQAVVNEANRLGYRAVAFRAEFRKLAADIEGPDGGRAA